MLGEGKVKLLLSLLFSIMAVYYAVRSVMKFQEKKISTSTHRFSEKDLIGEFKACQVLTLLLDRSCLDYPSVTICAGFKNEHDKIINVVGANSNSSTSLDLLGPERAKAFSYHRKDFITYFTQAIDNDWYQNLNDHDDLWTEVGTFIVILMVMISCFIRNFMSTLAVGVGPLIRST